MSHQSILAHLAPLLTSQLENVATEALAYLLLEYPFLPEAFRKYISSAGIDLPDNLVIQTQARWQDAAIPDLVGIDEEGSYLLIVESKFWAPLTKNQPATYLERLPPEKPAILLFIAPASRLQTLWQEILNRNSSSQAVGQNGPVPATQFLIRLLNNRHILALTSWESLLAHLYDKAQQARSEHAVGDVWQLQSLCAKIDADAFHPLSENEIISPTKKRIGQLRVLIDELVTRLVDSDVVSIVGYKATSGTNYYKRYMSIHDFHNWCIEYNDSYSKQYPPTKLWLTTTESVKLSGILSDLALVSYRQGKQFLIPLEIPMGVEKEAVINSLFLQVVEVSKRLVSQ